MPLDAKLEAGLGLGGTGGCCTYRKSDCPDKKKTKGSDFSFMCFSLTWTDTTRKWLVWRQESTVTRLSKTGNVTHKTPFTAVPILRENDSDSGKSRGGCLGNGLGR